MHIYRIIARNNTWHALNPSQLVGLALLRTPGQAVLALMWAPQEASHVINKDGNAVQA